MDLEGLNIPSVVLTELLSVDKKAWCKEAEDSAEFFQQFGDRLPEELRRQSKALKDRLA